MQILPRFERRKLIPRLILGAVIALVVSVAACWLFIHSEPYEFGTYFVTTDARVTAITGASMKTELRVWRGFSASFGDRSGSAKMTIRSLTDRGTYDVELKLEKRAGRWLVERAHVYPPAGAAATVVESACASSCS